MKHINLTQMLQGCSKRNGMTVRASNPDGEPTVNRQSRLMSLSGKKAEKEQLSPSCLLSASFPLSFRSRYLRYAAMILCVLVLSIGQAWGTSVTFSAAEIAARTKKGVIQPNCSTSTANKQLYKDGSTSKKFACIPISSSMGTSDTQTNAINSKNILFTADAGYQITGITIVGASNSSSTAKEVVLCWTGDISNNPASFQQITLVGYEGTSMPTGVSVPSIPSGTKSFGLYIKVKVDNATTPTALYTGSGCKDYGAGNSQNVYTVTVTYEAAPSKKIYLKNSMGWATAYVTRLGTESYWDGTNGSGSNGRNGTYAMTYDSDKKLFYYDAPAGANDKYLCFTKDKQENYNNFHNTEAVYVNGGYTFGKVIWVGTNTTFTRNGTKYYGNEDHSGVNKEDYSEDVFLCGTYNEWAKNNDAKFTAGTPFTKTVSLTAGTVYKFKVVDNAWFGQDNVWVMDDKSGLTFSQTGADLNLLAPITGDYTFTYNRSTHAVTVTYPTHTHPHSGYVYIIKYDWTNAYLHAWYDNTHPMTTWGSDLQLSHYVDICGTEYWCIPVLSYYSNFIVKDKAGDPSNTTGDQSFTSHGNQNMYHNGSSWGWHDFTTYTVTAAASTAGYGAVSPASVSSVPCGTSISASSNTLTVGATSVTATATESGAQYTYAFDGWTWTPAGATVTSDVTATANFTRTLNSYTVTWKNGATTLETDASVNYGVTPTYDGSTPTKAADALYTYTFSGWSPAVGAISGNTTYTAQFTATPKTVAYGDATIYAYNDSKRVVSGTRKTAMETALAGSNGETAISGSLPLLHSIDGLTSVVLAGNCKSEVKASFPWLGSYIKMNTATTTATITFNVASGYEGTATIYFSGYNKTATLTNGANSVAKTSDSKNPETEGSFTSKDIALVSGANTLTISGNNGYISRIDVALAPSCTSVAAPTDLTCSAQTSSSLTFTWEKAANASGYVASLYDNSACTGDPVASSVLGDVATETFNTLTASTTYYCMVQSKGDGSTYCATGGTTSAVSGTTSAAATLTAISADMQYNAADMANITFTGSDQHFTGLSTNHLFKVYGTLGSTDAFGKNETIGNITDDISTKSFTSALYITAANNTSSTSDPTQGAIEFITPSTSGILYLYLNGTASTLTLKKKDTSTSTSLSGAKYKAMTVDANTHYFINGAGSGNRGLYAIKYVSTYAVSITPTNVTKTNGATGTGAAIHGKAYTATFTAPVGYTLPSDVTSLTIGGVAQTKGTGYTWTISDGTATLTVPAAKVTGNIVVSVAGVAAVTHDVTFSLTNVAYSSGDNQGTGAATEGSAFSTVFAASSGYSLPGTITVEIGDVEQTEGTGYTWAKATGTLTIPAAYVTGDIEVTIVGEELEGDGCEELVNTRAASASTLTTSVGSATLNSPSSQSYSGAIKLNSSGYIEVSPKAGSSFAAGDSLIVVIYNGGNGTKTTGFKIGDNSNTTDIAKAATHTFRQKLVAANIVSSKVKFERATSEGYYVSIIIKHCEDLDACTTPTLPTLSNQTVCPGSDIAEWDATVSNASAISAAGESVAYSWKKKGNDTEIEDDAKLDLGSSATEGQAGTYVVTATVSKTGRISKSASREVTLTVTPTTEEPSVTQSPAKVYTSGSVTLTATCGSEGAKTWQWYTCTNAAGDGESILSGKNSAEYAFTAPASAGTYYYKVKVTGDGTNACGTASHVYALSVNAATGGDCTTYYWFANADDATTNSVTQNESSFFSGAKSGTNNNPTTITVDETELTITKRIGASAETVTFTVPSEKTATLYVNAKANSSSKPLILVRTATSDTIVVTTSTTLANYSAENITAGAWKLTCGSGNNWYYGAIIVKVCSAGSCTDAEPVATATNTTVCSGTALTITATGYETSPTTIQWQKKNGSSWDNISGATTATYTVASAAAEHAGTYRVQVTKGCVRNSNEVTITVPSAPVFGAVPASVNVMQTIALSINTVEATDATKYKWYKSADATWDAGDIEIGTNKELIKAYDSEAIGNPSYYIFCRAQNACGITTSTAIQVNVTAYEEEDCATRGNEGDAEFGFENSGCGQGTYNSASCWTMNSNSKKLVYAAPDGKYFKTMKVTIASSSVSKASYNWSTNGGTTYTGVAITGLTTMLTEKTIDLSEHGNVNSIQIGRNFDDKGESSGTLYVSKICFEYTDACTATTVTPSTESTSYVMGGAWSNPTFTLSVAGTLTYSSSNEDIASVDDDGTVTFNGEAGTVTITASYAGGTISATEYCASSGSYTITVSCSGGAPKVVADSSTDLVSCSSSVTLQAKKQDDTAFDGGTYQWFRNGEEIDGATSSSYTARQAGTYTVAYTSAGGCTSLSTNSAVVTSTATEPEVERLVPFQYYHVDKTYSNQMKMRHLFAVKNSGTLEGKHFKMYVSRNGGAATDVTSSNALEVWPNGDGHVDTVMVDLNKLSGKYSENDELVFTCKAIDCDGNVSEVYKNTITMNVIGATPTLALICSGSNKASGTRKTSELTVGGDFLTGYNVADLCQQTGNTSFNANTEWGLYTELKTQYIVTPVNGYAVFNKLNYEPFDILLLTDYPKASKSDAAKDILDDMAALCDYRPMLSFKTHMVAKSPSKWAAKGFTTSATENKADGRLNLNIVCYAHPMFNSLKTGDDVYTDVGNTSAPLVYTMLSDPGYESSKGMQGFEIAAAENFVTIGLTHYNATIAKDSPETGKVTWTPGSGDRMLVTVAERQANPEARFILFSLNCGAQSKLTEKGEDVVLACLNYLLGTAEGTIEPADCSFTFDNGENNEHDASWYSSKCPSCTGTKGDGKWTTAANWGPDYNLLPGEFNSVRIKKPVEVNDEHAHVMDVRIIDEGRIDIPANKALDVKSTIRRMDGSEIYPTEISDIHIGSASTGNGTLIFNNDEGDTKARVDMYSKGFIDHSDQANEPKGVKNYQYMGTPFIEVNAVYNYYGSWIYYWKADGSGWKAVKNGGSMTAWTGYCITQEAPTTHAMSGTLTATGTVDINVPADANMVVGNSWTAPIDINALTADDLEGLTASIYFFNTGVDKEGTAGNADGDRYAGGTYVTVPVNTAPYTGDDHIPSLQGFFVNNTGSSAGTLHLDYERHVRKTTRDNILSGELHAPARRTALSSDEPVVLKMKVSGENYDDKLLLLEREDFTEGFDNGWDGDKWDGNESALYIYTTDNNGTENSVSAIPELEGTIIGFRAGEDDAYTLNFEYLNSDEPIYLYDTENSTYTQIMTGVTYRFFTSDKSKHARFILTRKSPQIATGVGNVSGDEVQGTKAKKLLIEDKMFIMVNGVLYDATGKAVK